MDVAKWHEVETLFQSALDLPLNQRRGHVDGAGDPDVQREVLSLLEAYEHAEDMTDVSVSFDLQGVTPRDACLVGSRIGPYAVIRELGRGGMSRVLLATRADDEFHRWVAVKILQSHVRESRFLAERQILAHLDHPNIAVLFDGGTTPERLPYLVMEYVDGEAIDEYCESRNLSIDQRLELFDGVCSALSYAHRKLVIHRDVKPSNILVDTEGSVKLLDFGIAKLLDPEELACDATATEMRPLTPAYASPEHLRGEPMTTSSDVYSLGVLLYKLLTGALPHPAEYAKRWAALAEGHEPVPPSQVAGHLNVDLDAVVMRALAPEPDRRYGSVAHLAEDLKRYRRGWPVEARPHSTLYRFVKLLRRHPLGFATAFGFMTFLVVVSVVLVFMAARITRERDQARIERDKARQVTSFMVDVFGMADPEQARSSPKTVLETLDRGARVVDRKLARQPEIRAALLEVMGRVYRNLGAFNRASEQLREALALRRKTLGFDHPESLATQSLLAALYTDLGDFARSEALLRATLVLQENILGRDHREVAETAVSLGVVAYRTGDLEEAEELQRRALDFELRRSEHTADVAILRFSLGRILYQRSNYEAAEAEMNAALTLGERIFDGDDPRLLRMLKGIAYVDVNNGRLGKAEELYLRILDAERRIFPGDHDRIAFTLNHLGKLKAKQGDLEAAADLAESGLAMRRRLFGEQHLSIAASTSNLAGIEHLRGNHLLARKLFARAIEMARMSLPSGNPWLAQRLIELARCMMGEGEITAAEPLLVEALEILRRDRPAGHPEVSEAEAQLEQCRRMLGKKTL